MNGGCRDGGQLRDDRMAHLASLVVARNASSMLVGLGDIDVVVRERASVFFVE